MSDDGPILDQINLVTDDVAATVAFYRLLGVEIPESPPEWSTWDQHHRNADFGTGGRVDMDIDSTDFAAHWGGDAIPSGPLLSFRVSTRDAVDALYERLTAAGHRGLRAPYDAFWGARFAIVSDPGGTAVGLMSERSEGHRGPPPDIEDLSGP